MAPLLSLMRTTGVKPLASRASAIVVDYPKRMKKARNNKEVKQSGLTADVIFPYLAEVHEEARQGGDSHDTARRLVRRACCWLSRCMCWTSHPKKRSMISTARPLQQRRGCNLHSLRTGRTGGRTALNFFLSCRRKGYDCSA